MPVPTLVNAPVVAVEAPDMVNVDAVVLTSIVDVVPAISVKFLLVDAVTPVYLRVPPSKTKLAASLGDAPILLFDPPFASVETDKIPPETLVTPV